MDREIERYPRLHIMSLAFANSLQGIKQDSSCLSTPRSSKKSHEDASLRASASSTICASRYLHVHFQVSTLGPTPSGSLCGYTSLRCMTVLNLQDFKECVFGANPKVGTTVALTRRSPGFQSVIGEIQSVRYRALLIDLRIDTSSRTREARSEIDIVSISRAE